MNQNNLKIYTSKFLPSKPLETPSTKRFIRNYPRKELIPHKPKIELTTENFRRNRYQKMSNFADKKEKNQFTSIKNEFTSKQFPLRENNYLKNKVFTKSNKVDFDKTHVFHFNKDKIFVEKHRNLPPIYKYDKKFL